MVVKAQIHAGGRGKGGGVKVAKTLEEAEASPDKILGMQLVTHQTGPEGQMVQRLLIEETLPIERELYLGIVLDRATGKPVFMASAAGGMEIEEVAAEDSGEDSERSHRSRRSGLRLFRRASWRSASGLPGDADQRSGEAHDRAVRSASSRRTRRCAEINPFILTKDGKVFALDAKINFDDNALFRHKDLLELRDLNEEDPLEVEASKFGLNYIKLDGNDRAAW